MNKPKVVTIILLCCSFTFLIAYFVNSRTVGSSMKVSTKTVTEKSKLIAKKPKSTLEQPRSTPEQPQPTTEQPRFTPEQPQPIPVKPQISPFNEADELFSGFCYDKSEDEIVQKFGRPLKIELFSPGSTAGGPEEVPVDKIKGSFETGTPTVDYFYYPFGYIAFTPLNMGHGDMVHRSTQIRIENKGLYGPRKIRVGDKIDTVIGKFPKTNNNPHKNNEEQQVIYGKLDYSKNNHFGFAKYDITTNKMYLVMYGYGQYGDGSYNYLLVNVENGLVTSFVVSQPDNDVFTNGY